MLGLIWIQTLMVFQKEVFLKVDFEKKTTADDKNSQGGKALNWLDKPSSLYLARYIPEIIFLKS